MLDRGATCYAQAAAKERCCDNYTKVYVRTSLTLISYSSFGGWA